MIWPIILGHENSFVSFVKIIFTLFLSLVWQWTNGYDGEHWELTERFQYEGMQFRWFCRQLTATLPPDPKNPDSFLYEGKILLYSFSLCFGVNWSWCLDGDFIPNERLEGATNASVKDIIKDVIKSSHQGRNSGQLGWAPDILGHRDNSMERQLGSRQVRRGNNYNIWHPPSTTVTKSNWVCHHFPLIFIVLLGLLKFYYF